MLPTVRRLLEDDALALESIVPGGDGALDAPVRWAHGSDLADPTPFLEAGQVLLTTGTQFGADPHLDPAFADVYVRRLVDAGVVGLGFGTEVIREGTPSALVAACTSAGLPLFEVPYRIPFIAIARTVADAIAADAYARQSWALDAQRAVSRAALRPDGLTATLGELSRRLDAWVGLVDASGMLDREAPAGRFGQPHLGEVVGEARELLRRGRRASRDLMAGASVGQPVDVTLQTLGAGGALRGVLAIGGSAQLDQAGRELVTSVIALAGLALEQNRDLDRARGHLRSGLLRSILAGDLELAADVAAEMWGRLPTGEVAVLAADAPAEQLDRLTERLELRAAELDGGLFHGVLGSVVVVFVEASDADRIAAELSVEFELNVGMSDPGTLARAAAAHDEASRALERARESAPGVVRFDEISRQGVLAFLARTDARAVANATLAPLVAHDASEGSALVATVRCWLEHGGQFDAAAQELGVHRHTVRNRIALAEKLLGRDLSGFHAKADLWAALLATA